MRAYVRACMRACVFSVLFCLKTLLLCVIQINSRDRHVWRTMSSTARVDVTVSTAEAAAPSIAVSTTGAHGCSVDGHTSSTNTLVTAAGQTIRRFMLRSQDVYLLHNCVYYIHFTVILTHFVDFIFISFNKIIVSLDSSYINTYKTTPSSTFYTVYYQGYSDYKNFGEGWRPS